MKHMPAARTNYHLEENVQKYYGYKYLVPAHQGRRRRNIISKIPDQTGNVRTGQYVFLQTTRLHQELAGGTFVDLSSMKLTIRQTFILSKEMSISISLIHLSKKLVADKIPYITIE